MRRAGLLFALVALVACDSPARFENARAGAQARAVANLETAKAACRERGNQVFEFPDGDWVCGAEAKARRDREAQVWRDRCAAQGTQVFRGGLEGWYCANPTSDAGRECRSGTECESYCLVSGDARRGTCAPATAMVGCFSVLTDTGERGTLCVD